MKDETIIQSAENFLTARAIWFVRPGSIVRRTASVAEICFSKPETLDPNVVVDPPDVRVFVYLSNGNCELVPQM